MRHTNLRWWRPNQTAEGNHGAEPKNGLWSLRDSVEELALELARGAKSRKGNTLMDFYLAI